MRKLIAILIVIVLVAAVPAIAHDNMSGACAVSRGITSPGTIRGFDPQPDPPAAILSHLPSSGLDKVGFNPQPDPPADPFRMNTQFCDGSV
ncbi:MAG: hypothetical protein ABI700_11170 [Chloroflexota bacterium]